MSPKKRIIILIVIIVFGIQAGIIMGYIAKNRQGQLPQRFEKTNTIYVIDKKRFEVVVDTETDLVYLSAISGYSLTPLYKNPTTIMTYKEFKKNI